MSGPPKTPTHLRLIRGNPSKRAINKNEPKPEKGVPPTPKHFNKQERYWFKVLCERLDAIGVITAIDGMALELLVGAYVEWRKHRDVIDKEGETYKTTSTDGNVMIRPHPQVAMMADAWKRICRMQAEFGMTPASRSKVNGKAANEIDPFVEFLKSRID
ncbi:phage terminase small subunit P27 family [Arsenophonus nasoniae]|uniref:Phage terminase small subunit P27 family n=1 Tax=Arsenophonus nasoniae TaxID=638 RepID=A0ABY8NR90_9GAMM|nr:phage terminase small subunit P27 family [Arsenophonus nasoniae]WGM06852.1 phage terminase small subunit P27 family [Arsenophonus nasoniae]WGM11651.1 phage terminase small subunit P27 family [Arsenophonus nasoniae]WGM12506.1 phage terminase small subunit P27 family [Arsenophonus nasoniae]WGM16341.1 phage terminase small subunit P27 family [Arsenophonus nasoniae]WGM17182.1 phage terminase small subunit P27 family [Arsenophonus nasoniae]